MATISIHPAPARRPGPGGPHPAGVPVARRGGSVGGLVGGLLRAALCASSAPDLDRCGVLRTAVAQARPHRAG
jgi:hypothetical protein